MLMRPRNTGEAKVSAAPPIRITTSEAEILDDVDPIQAAVLRAIGRGKPT
jgi:hypothetical protein